MLFLFCEIGSHSFLDHHDDHDTPNGVFYELAGAAVDGHESECSTSVVCEPEGEHDPSAPDVQDQMSHHDVVVASMHTIDFNEYPAFSEPHPFARTGTEFRPTAPPFHPPKIS